MNAPNPQLQDDQQIQEKPQSPVEKQHKSLLTRLWDWVDRRDADKHAVSIVILSGTYVLTQWAMRFAEANSSKSGTEIAAIIAAVTAPYLAVQAAAIKFYFESRPTDQVNPR